jgi:N-acetylmuramic acid 6-phosphate etherase
MSFVKITEQSSLYDNLEAMPVSELLYNINNEDQKAALAVRQAIPQIERLVSELVPRMEQGGRLFYIGAGTSGRLGVLDASEIPPTFGMLPTWVIGVVAGGDKALRCPVEGAEDDADAGWTDLLKHGICRRDTLVGIAASGTTPYVVGALTEARKNNILTASISSNPNSPASCAADIAIELVVGPEFVTGSSRMKSGTAQKMALNMISTATMIRLGRVKGNRMVNMQLSNVKLIDRGTRMIADELGLDYEEANRLLLLHGSVKKALENRKL